MDFSTKTFHAVVDLCKDLGIRYPEELSLCKPLESAHLKKNYSEFPKRKFYMDQNGYLQPAPDTNTFIPNSNTFNGSSHSLDAHNGPFSCAPVSSNGTLSRSIHSNGTPISSPTGVSRLLISNHSTPSVVNKSRELNCKFLIISDVAQKQRPPHNFQRLHVEPG